MKSLVRFWTYRDGYKTRKSFHAHHDGCNQVDDLLRCLYVMDGRPEPDHRDGMYHQLSQAIAEIRQEFATDYIKMRWSRTPTGI